ncbi:MAG: kinase/pyrophosphorylase [Geminicoccaceae bacterium]
MSVIRANPDPARPGLTIIDALPGIVVFTLTVAGAAASSRNIAASEEFQRSGPGPSQSALTNMLGSADGRRSAASMPWMMAGFSRIEAMDFAMRHDDGQFYEELDRVRRRAGRCFADVETPPVYHNRGLKSAIFPIVPDLPQLHILELQNLVVGLTINPGHSFTSPQPAEDAGDRSR